MVWRSSLDIFKLVRAPMVTVVDQYTLSQRTVYVQVLFWISHWYPTLKTDFPNSYLSRSVYGDARMIATSTEPKLKKRYVEQSELMNLHGILHPKTETEIHLK